MKYINQQLEMGVLGSIIETNGYLASLEFMETKHFAFAEHRIIWEQLLKEIIRLGRVDAAILRPFFKNSGFPELLNPILMEAKGVVDVRAHGLEILHLWQKREFEEKLENALKDLEVGNFDTISGNLEEEIKDLQFQESKKKTVKISQVLKEFEEKQKLGTSTKLIPTGLAQLDKSISGGIRGKQLVVIAGRAGIGKTTISQNILLNASKLKKNCLFISMEMNRDEVLCKFLSNLTSINSTRIEDNRINQGEQVSLDRAKTDLKGMELFLNDSGQLKINEIEDLIKRQIKKAPIDLIVIDYVQIIKGSVTKNKLEHQIIKENTTLLKDFAKKFDVAIVALAQINRNGAEAPKIQDLKGSGGIEEDADVVILIHRDLDKSNKFLDSGSLIVAKNRKGYPCDIAIQFDGNFGRFTELNF